MSSDNQVGRVAITQTTARQTPRNDFGEVLAQTLPQVAATGLQFVQFAVSGMPVASAAVAGMQMAVGAMAKSSGPVASQSTTAAGGAGATGGTGAAGGGDAREMMQMQQAMQTESFQMNAMYLQMQRDMQRESREYTALSNLMKVRHDTAKSAINNVR